ncbi:entericidin A/B family lipoprotein [Desulfuromonas sp. CSMB_57]|jgi:predicted small secreted protein|nr:entericidin A/B family lipoprotein [Desulfuromonas sp. CSMB_57]
MKITILILLILSLAACNTISGIGRDIEKVGEAIHRGAN